MQSENHKCDYGKRAEYHAAHVLNHYTKKGIDWEDIPQVFQISVLNFVFDNGAEKNINHYILRNEEGRSIANVINVIFLELPKIAKLDDDISRLTKAQMWGKFFLYAPVPEKADYVRRLTEANGGIKMAFTVLKNVSQDELNWYHESRYWMHVSDELTMKNAARREGLAEGRAEGRTQGLAEGRAEGRTEGLAEGLAEGEHKKAVETAQNLIKLNSLSIEQISQAIGLPIEEVQKLADETAKA